MITLERTDAREHRAPLATSSRCRRWTVAGLAATALVLTSLGLSGIGDAPDPHASSRAIATWFTARRSEILHAAPFGYLGALAIVALTVAMVRDAHARPAGTSRTRALLAGGVVTATYLVGAHIAWSSNSYLIAESSPAAAKAVFVLTIVSIPVFAIGVSLLAGAGALLAVRGAARRWWCISSAAIATTASLGIAAIADQGFFSPDTQQQVIGNLLLVWLLITGIDAALPTKPTSLHPSLEHQEVST
jgi:hypothetical protein